MARKAFMCSGRCPRWRRGVHVACEVGNGQRAVARQRRPVPAGHSPPPTLPMPTARCEYASAPADITPARRACSHGRHAIASEGALEVVSSRLDEMVRLT